MASSSDFGAALSPQQSRAVRTVLLVDGNPMMLYYHGIILMRLGYSVLTATTPEESFKIIDKVVPTIIVTSVVFPSMGGMEFVKNIKVMSRTRTVPVVVLAGEDERLQSACFELGCHTVSGTPADPSQLYRTIQAATEKTPRENIRLNASLKVEMRDDAQPSDDVLVGLASCISEGGVFFRTPTIDIGTSVKLLKLYIAEQSIDTHARLLYTRRGGNGAIADFGMAMKFTDIQDVDRAFLRAYIHKQLTAGIALAPQ